MMLRAALAVALAAAAGLAITSAAERPHLLTTTTSRPHPGFGHMPLPVAQTIEKQNGPQDKLRIDVTHSEPVGGKYVSYVRIVWGDLDNLIKGGGPQFYSNWDGNLSVTGATADIVHKIAFDDGKVTTRPHIVKELKELAKDHPPRTGLADKGPHEGSGRDEVLQAQGGEVIWKAGVVGALDGLLIKITSDKPEASGTIKAGKFDVSFNITAAPATPAPAGSPALLKRLAK